MDRVTVTGGGATAESNAILGMNPAAKIAGLATEVGTDIVHPNGNIYDQVRLQGNAATVTADPDQVTRISYVDLTDDIVQVEFAGAGALTLALENASGPAAPVNYNQDVAYMKGHASIVVSGADESTHGSVFSVGRANAVNQTLFRDGTAYDGFADISHIAIASRDGKFGGLRTGNASYFNTRGATGIFAPGVTFTGPVVVGDLDASVAAIPMLRLGLAGVTKVAGGSATQTNGRAVQVSGITELQFVDGMTSQGKPLPAQSTPAHFEQDGFDVTADIVKSGP